MLCCSVYHGYHGISLVFFFSVKMKNNFLSNGKTTRMGWRRLEQRVFTFILHISFLFKLITFVLVDFSAIARFFLICWHFNYNQNLKRSAVQTEKPPRIRRVGTALSADANTLFFPSSLCCLLDLCLIQWSLKQVNYWRVKLCLHYETQVKFFLLVFTY